MSTTYETSDAVVVIGHGVGHVNEVTPEHITVAVSDGTITIKQLDADRLMRRVVSESDAQRHLERLCERCTEPRTLPVLRSIRELARATLDTQIEYARWYFRKKKSLERLEVDVIVAVSEVLVAELALALRASDADLRLSIKRGKPVIERRTVRVLPEAPLLSSCQHIRSFWMGNTACVGERPESAHDIVRVSVEPGAWHAYLLNEVHEEDPDEVHEGLLLRHAGLGVGISWVSAQVDVGGVNIEGGVIGVIDADAISDVAFGIDEVERTRHEGEGYGDRGVEAPTNGDGNHGVLVDREARATCIFLSF
jgi:hypothetical protein